MTSRRRAGRTLLAVVGALVLLAAALLAGPVAAPPPLDPRSPAPDGLLGVVELLRASEVTVDVAEAPPESTGARVLVAGRSLAPGQRDELADWVRRGGTLVAADAGELHELPVVDQGAWWPTAEARTPDCGLLEPVGEVVQERWPRLRVPPGASACFGDEAAWLVVVPRGRGRVVALASAEALTNARLAERDNPVLAARLLAPSRGDHLVVLEPGSEGGLLPLVPARAWRTLGIALGAALLALWWRGRRLGTPVAERLPPTLPDAELARSVAGLLHRARDRTSAGARLRRDARAAATDALGVDAQPDVLAGLVARRTGLSAATSRTALEDGPVHDDAALLAVARATRALRRALDRTDHHPEDPDGPR